MTPDEIAAYVLGEDVQVHDRPEEFGGGRMVLVTLAFPLGLIFSGEVLSVEGDDSIEDEKVQARAEALAKAAEAVAAGGHVFPPLQPAAEGEA